MSIRGMLPAGLILAAWLLCTPGGAGAGDPATPAVEESDLAFSVQVLQVPPAFFDAGLERAAARNRTTRFACPDTVHLFVISSARNIGSDTLRFCGMIDLEGGYSASPPDFAPPDFPEGGSRYLRRGPTLYVLPRSTIPEEPFHCRSAVLAPGESFADTLRILYCAGECRDHPGTLHLSGPFPVGEAGEKNERVTIVVENAVEVDIEMP